MKKITVSILLAICAGAAQGQWLGPQAVGGALFGGLIGGIAGGDRCHGFSGSGAAIGAGVGLLAGAIVDEAQRRDAQYYDPIYSPPLAYAQPGYGYVYAPAPVYYAPPRPNYAVDGTLLGALGGGLIGASQHKGWEGAGIGAAAGLVVGTAAEIAAEKQEPRAPIVPATPPPPQVVVAAPPPPVALAAPNPPPPTVAPLAPRFAVAAPPARQIPDAPRVPDAPTF